MSRFALIAVLLVSVANALPAEKLTRDYAKNWAILVAGSKGYINYRHQANVAHAYQMLRSKNFLPQNIIVMMFDDIANDKKNNPYHGRMFNNYSRIDVYDGLNIDYRGKMVNSRNFLKIMAGDEELKAQGHKVLESTDQDNVFLYFTGFGANAMVAFPNYNDYLFSGELMKTIETMSDKKRFKEFVIYFDSDESGSVFEPFTLPANVYALTATRGGEPSFAVHCHDHAIDACLGTQFSVNWIFYVETSDLTARSLQELYDSVRKSTTKSQPWQNGDFGVAKEKLNQIFGYDDPSTESNQVVQKMQMQDLVDSRDAHLVPHLQTLKRSQDPIKIAAAKEALQENGRMTRKIEKLIADIAQKSLASVGKSHHVSSVLERNSNALFTDCYVELVKSFSHNCHSMHEFPMVAKSLFKFKNLCHLAQNVNLATEKILQFLNVECAV